MKIAVGLGSSLGDRRRALTLAVRMLHAHPQIRYLRGSRLYRTPPLRGGSARGWFLNAVALFETCLPPAAFLEACVGLEQRSGRRRARHWGDRTLDLDLLLADDEVLDLPQLRVPHPAIADRPFVRIPLVEAWPEARDPISGRLWANFPIPLGPSPAPVGVLARGL